uniref:WRKY transcription factor 8 n=1 Tax=Tamarix hispida TaxID=189793 RepID=J9ZZY2_9CARY|nr:WRKY transcription factor 8 [Tamarix hispida]
MSENDSVPSSKPPAVSGRPTTITLPPRTSIEALSTGGLGSSPGPMTLVSSFFSDNDPGNDFRSFSQLLAGAMASPSSQVPNFGTSFSKDDNKTSGGEGDFRFKQNRPPGLLLSQPQMFSIPPGLSPASLLESPGGLFPGQMSPYGMSHQQALAHVTAQARAFPSPASSAPFSSFIPQISMHQNTMPSEPEPEPEIKEPPSYSETQQPPSVIVLDKPAVDGYNWRKYGQKQVKGSEFPRSYYKCTHPGCPVKKKVERSLDGQITEIIYKGQHNHPPPKSKRLKDVGNRNGSYLAEANPDSALPCQSESINGHNDGFSFGLSRKDQESSQATGDNISSDGEEVGNDGIRTHEGEEDESAPKRRNVEIMAAEQISSHRTVAEPRIIVQTTSEVDLLDDGYRWRKYGQKVVKANPYPRSYYKCTTLGCNVRKHIERAASDPKAVITTYEGKHNHNVPAPRNSSHNMAYNSTAHLRPQNVLADGDTLGRTNNFTINNQQPALLQLKEEQIT